MKPQVFIASSAEGGLSIAYAVQQNLEYDADCTVWSQGVFTPSAYPLDDIVAELHRSDFGIFVFSADDIIEIRKEQKKAVRDNVLFELGLFMGFLGRKRNFILQPKDVDLHIASDLFGLNPVKFTLDRANANVVAALGTPCNQIRTAIKDQGPRNQTVDQVIAGLDEKCCTLMGLRGRLEYFPAPPVSELAASIFDHAADRLRTLGALRFDLSGDGRYYAYHWTELGKLVLAKFGYNNAPAAGTVPSSGTVVSSPASLLSPKAQALLRKASGSGSIIKSNGMSGYSLQIGEEEFCEHLNERGQAEWKAAYEELVTHELVDDGPHPVVDLKAKGYKWADQLNG